MKNQNKLAFVITAYEQVELVERNINRIRTEYGDLAKLDIIIVSTSEKDLFRSLELKYNSVYVIHFQNAPGNKQGYFEPMEYKEEKCIDWRHRYLPPRILVSIQRGLEKAYELGNSFVLHLHSDTYWQSDKLDELKSDLNKIKNKLVMGDISFFNEYASKKMKIVPANIHFQPEGLLFNLHLAFKIGFYRFEDIWFDNHFKSHNFSSTEALIGQFAIYCLTNKQLCVKDYKTKIPSIYFQMVLIRTIRNYHGLFKSGLVNLELSQEKVNNFTESDLLPRRPSIKCKFHAWLNNYEV